MSQYNDLEKKKIEEMEKVVRMTICTTMHCYNKAEETDDPGHPPFCEQCQDRNKNKKFTKDNE